MSTPHDPREPKNGDDSARETQDGDSQKPVADDQAASDSPDEGTRSPYSSDSRDADGDSRYQPGHSQSREYATDPYASSGYDAGQPQQGRPQPGQPSSDAYGSSPSAQAQYQQYQPGQDYQSTQQYQSGQPHYQSGQPHYQSGQPHYQSGQPHYQSGQPQGGHPGSGADPHQGGQPSQGQNQSGAQYQPGPYVAHQPGQDPYGVHDQHSGRSKPAGFFKSLFDFRFNSFIAVRWAGIIYIITVIVAALSWIGTIISSIMVGIAAGAATNYYVGGAYDDSPGFSPWPLIFAILFGWIIPLLWVIFVRLVLELVVSSVKTAEHTKTIADSVGR
ncbi:DUF4282 domain-containing protein [Brevibacterium sp.]|uniref:DUF4282 domain-containing protein n=1 Tax=Brevibacterium sp. TaxID=1701 RepID=UPI002810F39C|nr:DUF4282 domain-containing protein [Brevibacterium sp.]